MSSLRRQHGRKSLPCCQLLAAIRLNLGVRPHMEIVASLCFVIAAVLTAIYLHALAKLHGILRNERPELVEHRGSLSFFYTGMPRIRSEEHTSELQSLMRTSYAVFCLKKKQ